MPRKEWGCISRMIRFFPGGQALRSLRSLARYLAAMSLRARTPASRASAFGKRSSGRHGRHSRNRECRENSLKPRFPDRPETSQIDHQVFQAGFRPKFSYFKPAACHFNCCERFAGGPHSSCQLSKHRRNAHNNTSARPRYFGVQTEGIRTKSGLGPESRDTPTTQVTPWAPSRALNASPLG